MSAVAPTASAATVTMPAFVSRVRLRAERRVLWLRKLWSAVPEATRALAIADEDVDVILTDPAVLSAREEELYTTDPRARALTASIEDADTAAAADPALALLQRAFRLDAAELDLLSLCIAAEADPALRRVYGYIHDDATMGYATPWLAASLFQWDAPAAFGPGSPLVHWRLARPAEGVPGPAWSPATAWVADPFASSLVLHGELHDALVASAIEPIDTRAHGAAVTLYPRELEQLVAFILAMREGGDGLAPPPIELELVAPAGAGKRTLAAQLCARLGAAMIAVDGAALQTDPALAVERAFRAARLAHAANAVLYWHGGELTDPRVAAALDAAGPLIVFGSESPRPRLRARAARKTVTLPRLGHDARRMLWSVLSDVPMPEDVVQWSLTPAEMTSVAAVAAAGPEEVAAACRSIVHRAPGEVFSPLPCPYTWDDIILPAPVRQHLQEVETQARLRAAVLEEWGFERTHPSSRGVSALFAGPSGTGKTMATQVLARSLGMELYRVDLAGVVNKYIGETEKRLKLVFDACERSNVLLLFDEADALFGQRTQVKDAHDRFANIEIDYLLQRMEQFEGIAVLATNRRSDLDKAFVRRLRFIIDFMQPGPGERLALWRRALPEATPAGESLLEDVDFDLLASRLVMNGATIKAAALSAAFLARAEGTRITMRHIYAAARREMTKHGIELRTGDLVEVEP